ncbi:hypothetical protein DOY81_015578, partial [Sarcophaga bullata]
MTAKKLRFRGDLNFQNRIDDLYDEVNGAGAAAGAFNHRRSSGSVNTNNKDSNDTTTKSAKEETGEREAPSFMDFFKLEM